MLPPSYYDGKMGQLKKKEKKKMMVRTQEHLMVAWAALPSDFSGAYLA